MNHWGKIYKSKTIVCLLSVILSSCAPSSKIFSNSTSTENLALPSNPQSREEIQYVEPPATRWDVYYSNIENAAAEIRVMEPLGTSRPMGKLLASAVAENLERAGIKSSTQTLANSAISLEEAKKQNIFVLAGNAEFFENDSRISYDVIIRWVLSDASGQVIATHSQGVVGSKRDWDVGDPRIIKSVGQGIGEPIAELVLAEVKQSKAAADPLIRGVLMAGIVGLSQQDALLLGKGIKKELLSKDILVTEDPRQATYVIGALVQTVPTSPGNEMVSIIWRVGEINGKEMGNAVQEKEVPAGSMDGHWNEFISPISQAAAKGIARIMADSSLNPMPQKPLGGPPAIELPSVPGRALPPPP